MVIVPTLAAVCPRLEVHNPASNNTKDPRIQQGTVTAFDYNLMKARALLAFIGMTS